MMLSKYVFIFKWWKPKYFILFNNWSRNLLFHCWTVYFLCVITLYAHILTVYLAFFYSASPKHCERGFYIHTSWIIQTIWIAIIFSSYYGEKMWSPFLNNIKPYLEGYLIKIPSEQWHKTVEIVFLNANAWATSPPYVLSVDAWYCPKAPSDWKVAL